MSRNIYRELRDALKRATAIHGNSRGVVDAILEHVNASVPGCHGVEEVYQGDDKPSCVYVNRGDTYSPTVLFDDRLSRFLVTSWGDWLEEQERNGYQYN